MASYNDLVPKHRLFMEAYPFSRYASGVAPCTKLLKPLRVARIALITTAGLRTPDQEAFDKSIIGGDSSFREIPNSAATSTLIESQKSSAFDHSGILTDANLAFPLDRFRELLENGEFGSLNERHFSFMGSITDPEILIEESAPKVAEQLRGDGVDIAFLTPV